MATPKEVLACDATDPARLEEAHQDAARFAADAPVIAGSAEHARLIAEGKLTGRVVISPDGPIPSEPIL